MSWEFIVYLIVAIIIGRAILHAFRYWRETGALLGFKWFM